jgi:hypothetical protein
MGKVRPKSQPQQKALRVEGLSRLLAAPPPSMDGLLSCVFALAVARIVHNRAGVSRVFTVFAPASVEPVSVPLQQLHRHINPLLFMSVVEEVDASVIVKQISRLVHRLG